MGRFKYIEPLNIKPVKSATSCLDCDSSLPERLNDFFCRFENNGAQTSSLPLSLLDGHSTFSIPEHDVRRLLRHQKINKAAGPDGVTPAALKSCADQLASILTYIFNWSQHSNGTCML